MANGFEKIYGRNYWVNNTPPAINEVNLNNLENGVNTLDDRVVTLDKTKLDQITANTMVKDVTFDEATGIFTVTKLNGAAFTIDTKLEKIAVNFRFDKENQVLVIVLDDGTEQQVDLSALITQYEFLDSDTVVFTISADGKVSANIKDGSITDEKLEPNYLANITVQAGKAQASANAAAQSASDADYDAKLAQSYAVGGSGIRDGEDTDNAKYYKEQAQNSSDSASNSASSALLSSQTATTKASEAATSSANAKTSESNAKASETAAKTSETNAKSSEVSSLNSANKAAQSETNSERNANLSESYAVGTDGTIRPNDNVDCAKYYYEQARQISEGLSGGLLPMGTITFSQLASQTKIKGYMYNISDEFVTDETFKEGSGLTFPAGSNVYWTADGYWDVLAGSPVTGVKGSAESSYRRGNVNITPANIGLGNVPNVSTNNQTPTYTASTSLTALTSGEKLSVAFGKIAKAVTDLMSHLVDTVSHITALERTAWNNAKDKADVTNIACGTCDTAGNIAEKVVTLEGNDNWTLKPGAIIMVKFASANTASNVTLNVNGTGGKQIWYGTSVYTGSSSTVCGTSDRYHTYMYNGTHWVWLSYGQDANKTYTNQSLGQGYATCTTSAATTAKVATLSGYGKTLGGIVAVKFTYAVPANATLNINNRGANAIYHNGSAIKAGVIKAGDTATFIYDGSYYHLLAVDSQITDLANIGTIISGTDSITLPSGTWIVSANAKTENGNYTIYGVVSNIGGITSTGSVGYVLPASVSISGIVKTTADLTLNFQIWGDSDHVVNKNISAVKIR